MQNTGIVKLIPTETESATAHISEGKNAPSGIVPIRMPGNIDLPSIIRTSAIEIKLGNILEVPRPVITTDATDRYFCPINTEDKPRMLRMPEIKNMTSGLTFPCNITPAILPMKNDVINKPTPGIIICCILIPNDSEK